MKRTWTILATVAAAQLAAGNAVAEQPRLLAPPAPPSLSSSNYTSAPTGSANARLTGYLEDTAQVVEDGGNGWECGDVSCGDQASCACEDGCGCDVGCGSGCGCGNGGWGCLGDCCLGDAWTLQSCLHPCCDSPTYGGWFSFGYYNRNERLSFNDGDELSFNDFPHHLNLDQAWFYVEKVAEANACSADWGYRFDIMYGAQGHAAQSFGNDGGTWDVTWDHGVYEWAIPQLYGEVAFGDWSWKLGHWFTPAGYEVIPATGNFFYTHTLTHYNSEPFTHTGALGTYSASDELTLYAGWALGWDTGFDQFDDGNIFIGGFTRELNDDVSFSYITTVGNLGWKSNGEDGFSHHVVATFALSENWEYVLQHDYLTTDEAFENPGLEIDDKGVTNYLFYTLNDCWKVGARAEWWKSNQVTGENTSFYDVTFGLNYRPHANFVVRPEIRYDWTPAEDTVAAALGEDRYNQWSFSVDGVFTY